MDAILLGGMAGVLKGTKATMSAAATRIRRAIKGTAASEECARKQRERQVGARYFEQ